MKVWEVYKITCFISSSSVNAAKQMAFQCGDKVEKNVFYDFFICIYITGF